MKSLPARKILYKEPNKIVVPKKDQRPHDIYPVYEYIITKSYANPFGIIISNNRIHIESMYSDQLPLSLLQQIRLKTSFLLKKKIKHTEPVLSIMHGYYNNFYHFSLECLVRIFLLKDHLKNNNAKILLPKGLKSYHYEWLELLGLQDQVIMAEHNTVIMSEKLITCNFPANSSNYHQEILKDFRNWVLSKINLKENNHDHKKIFIGRKNEIRRKITNIEQVKKITNQYGYKYIEMEDFTLEEQIKIVQASTHIVGIHGAALSHLIFAHKNTKVIEIINIDFHFHFYEKMCLALKIKYSSLLSEQTKKKDNPNHSDITVNTDDLRKAIIENDKEI